MQILAAADFNGDGFVDVVVAGGFQTGKIEAFKL